MFFDKIGSDDWRIRRRIVILTLLYCALIVAYALIWGTDNELFRSAVNGAFLLAGATVNGFVFGVVIDDKNKAPATNTTTVKVESTTTDEPPKDFAG